MTSISRRLLVGLTAAVGMSAALTVALLAGYETRNARADLNTELESSVSAFAKLIEPALWDMDFDRAARLAEAFGRDPRIASLTVRESTSGTTHTFAPLRTADTALRAMEVRRGDQLISETTAALTTWRWTWRR